MKPYSLLSINLDKKNPISNFNGSDVDSDTVTGKE